VVAEGGKKHSKSRKFKKQKSPKFRRVYVAKEEADAGRP
jgi:hypothetical protein